MIDSSEIIMTRWAKPNMERRDIFRHPDRKEVAKFLTDCGADLSKAESARESMTRSTNEGNAAFMKAVWGNENFKNYKEWAENYIHQYQATTYEHQPRLEKSGSVASGAIRVLCLLTRFAADPSFSDSRFALELDTRRHNGILRSQGKKREELRTLTRTDTGEVYHPGSFPPDFLNALVYEMQSWKK